MNRADVKGTADRRYFGIYIGLVVKSDASGDGPQARSDQGEVTVTLPWYDDSTRFPARVATLYGGDGFGAVWTPELDTEVVVAFENGDLRSPVVLGCLYNGQDKPPAVRSDRSDRKVFQTRAGHVLAFDDGPDRRGIELTTKDKHRVEIDDLNGRLTVSLDGGPSLTMTRTELALQATDITIKADKQVTIEAPMIRLN